MASFDFFPESNQLPPGAAPLIEEKAGTFTGVGAAAVKALPLAALHAGESLHVMATGLEPGLTQEERDAQFKRIEDAYRPYIEQLSPKPYDTGTAGQILSGFLQTLAPLATRGGAVGVVGTETLKGAVDLTRAGVDSDTAAASGVVSGLTNAAGFSIPFLGKSLATKVLSGVAGNVALGAGGEAFQHSLIDQGGYHELAQAYDPLNGPSRILDALLGGAFGGLAHHIEGSGRLAPEVADALLQLNRARQAARDSLPGRPLTGADLQAHTQALDTATRQLSQGQPVDVAGQLLGHNFGPDPYLTDLREQIRRLADEMQQRALGSGHLPSDIPRAETLTKAARTVEGRFAEHLATNFDKAKRDYAAIPETAGGKIINTDEARKLSVDYSASRESAGTLSSAVHEPASWFTKRLYEQKLAQPAPVGQDPVVIFTAGGAGAGKTSAIRGATGPMLERAQIIYDTNGNGFVSTQRKIDQALAAGKEVKYLFVARDPVESLTQGALRRAMNPANNGRTVPIKEHIATHVGSAETLPKLIEAYKGDPRVNFQVIDNTHGPGGARVGSIDTVQKLNFTDLEKRLYGALQQEYQAGRISSTVLRGTRGLDARAERPAATRGDLKSEQTGQATRARGKEAAPITEGVPDVPDIQGALAGSKAVDLGHVTNVTTERGERVAVRYAVIEADQLRTSHTDEMAPAPNYDQRLQPRERERASSEAQVARISNKLDFARLADSPGAADGAPIVGPDDQVESGNARSIAIRRAYANGKAEAYRNALQARALDLGLNPQVVAQMRNPVLIRQRVSKVPDRARFAMDANEQAQARMSLAEQARADASRITSLDGLAMNEDGSVNMRESRGFLRQFVQNAVSPTDQGALMRPDGSLSTEGTARVRNAIFARAYGDPELVSMLVEGVDQNVRNLLTGLSRAAGDMADIREGARERYYHPLDISADVAAAARIYAEVKGSGNSIDGYLAHQVLFDQVPILQQELLKAFDLHSRSGKRIGDLLHDYAELVRQQGNPNQASVLPELGSGLSRESLVAEAAKRMEPNQTRETATGSEKPIAEAVPEAESVEGRQAAAAVASNPDLRVAFDADTVLSGHEALQLADAQVAEAERIAALFDEVSADVTTEAASPQADYAAAPRPAFNPDQVPFNFDQVPASPQEAVQLSERSLEALERSPVELARSVAKGFRNAESAAIVGQKIRNVHDLAAAAQIYRNPAFETLRYVFVKNDHVIHATGVSSRMVGSAGMFATTNQAGAIHDMGELGGEINRLAADGVYLVHNHPSGNPQPSEADIRLTNHVREVLQDRFLGHVVVNHKKWALISPNRVNGGDYSMHPIENANLRTRPINHPVLDRSITGPSDVADIGRTMRELTSANSFVMIGRGGVDGRVTGVVEVPLEWLEKRSIRLLAEARRYKLNSGAQELFLVGPDDLQYKFKLHTGISSGLIGDVVTWDGKKSLRRDENMSPMQGAREGLTRPPRDQVVESDAASYDPGIGRPAGSLSPEQIDHMKGLVREKLRYLQSVKLRGFDPKVNVLSDQELAREASRQAAADLVAEAQAKKRRVELATVAADRNAATQDAHPEGKMRGLVSMMVRDKADKGSTQSFESKEIGTRAWALARLMPALEAANPHLFGLVEDKEGWRNLVREIYGERTGDPKALEGAKAWLGVMEDLRNQANYAGFDIAKLHSYRLPQSHSRETLSKVGAEQWIADVLPKLDRQRYTHEDGRLYTDGDLQAFLGQAYENIVTNGMNSLEPGQYRGTAALASKYQEHRAIHFDTADNYVDYITKYGESSSTQQIITGHVTQMARDIALVETFGPNPKQAFQTLLDRAVIAGDKDAFNMAQNLFHEISGASSPGEVPVWAQVSQGVRNMLVASKLGGAAISSLTDNATLHITAQINNLSPMQLFRNQLQAFNPLTKADRDVARANGLGLDIFMQSLNRWGEDGLGSDFTGKLAAGTLRASGLQALTEANKRAFGVTMMAGIGRMVRDGSFADLGHLDNRILASKGVTAADWAVWKKAELEDWGNGNDAVLSPQSIARIPDAALAGIAPDVPAAVLRNSAIAKLLGAVLEETDTAVITSGYRERAILRQGTTGGTPSGEIFRHVALFKSFPVAMIARHWSRALSMPTMAGKVGYATALFGGLTILGAVAMTIKDVAAGKDPRSMKDPRSWLAAMAQGGGLGIYGDYLFSDQSRYGNSIAASLAGPAAGVAEDAYNLTVGNMHQAIRGESTHAAAEALKFAKGNAPLINLWYTKAALDRYLLNDLQDYLSPGYLQRIRQTTHKNTGQDYWWEPGQRNPGRAPDWSAMTESP